MIKSTRTSERLTVFLSGEIDHHAAITIREEIEKQLTDMTIHTLLLDFTKVFVKVGESLTVKF